MVVLRRRSGRSSRRQALNAGHDPCVTLFPDHVLVSVLFGDIVQFEAKDPGHIAVSALWWDQLWVDLEQHVWETASIVGTVDRGVAGRFGVVDVLAAAAEQLHRLGVRDVGQGNGQQWVVVAQNARAAAEITLLELFQLLKVFHFFRNKGNEIRSSPFQMFPFCWIQALPVSRGKLEHQSPTIFVRPCVVMMKRA